MKMVKSYGYMVSAPKQMLNEVIKNMKDKSSRINWFNFSIGDVFYTDNGDYKVVNVDHKNKTIKFTKGRQHHGS